MADMKITEYNSHNAPATGDQFFMIGTSEEYRIDYDALASAILDKLTTKTYSGISNNVIDAIAALNSRLTPTNTTHAFTIANSSITNLERAIVKKFGSVIAVDITFTVGAKISENTAVLFTGLPKSLGGNMRFRLASGTNGSLPDLVLAITTDGTIINQWSNGGVPAGQWQGEFVYITSE